MVQRIGSVSYILALPTKAQTHYVFHVPLLKRFDGAPPNTMVPLPPIPSFHVAKVVKARHNHGAGSACPVDGKVSSRCILRIARRIQVSLY